LRLAALKIGFGVPSPPFSGVVHAAFAKAAILKVGSNLISIVTAASGGLPAAITVNAPLRCNFAAELAPGMGVTARAGVLRFAESSTLIDLRPAHRWRSRLQSIRFDFAHASTAVAWRSAAAALQADGRSSVIARLASAAILSLSAAARPMDIQSATRAADGLVGLGAGGTPAGDDVLVGFLAGLWPPHTALRQHADFVDGLAAHVRTLAGRTSAVSAVYLRAAALGQVSERLGRIIAAIADGEHHQELAEATAAAITVGHTSGADGMLGLLLGLAARGPESIFEESRRLVMAPQQAV
jgi:hypothetical protein